ncbi:NRDE family protein [Salinisphaera sp. T31B1]|uniref:NRDE family protein n=1 Tax=Salinisphaera sp. T31B1 TaxID=727963 RepID=UPI00334191AC
MCLIVFAWHRHPRHALVVAANRDEFHGRPTEPAHWWSEPDGLFAGRDRRAGGAWCAMGRGGRFAAVTNVREPDASNPELRSRGWLVRDYFAGVDSAADWAARMSAEGPAYGPFNLLIGDLHTLWFVSNRGPVRQRRLRPGVHAVSNGHWGEHWPKTDRSEAGLSARLDDDPIEAGALFDLLADAEPAPDAELPTTGIGTERERFLSAPFIVGETYGTRASTVITRDHDGAVDVHERGFGVAGMPIHQRHAQWRIDPDDNA